MLVGLSLDEAEITFLSADQLIVVDPRVTVKNSTTETLARSQVSSSVQIV